MKNLRIFSEPPRGNIGELRLHTMLVLQIVRHDRTMEQIVFPVPSVCEFLTEESKINVYHTCERDDQNSKV